MNDAEKLSHIFHAADIHEQHMKLKDKMKQDSLIAMREKAADIDPLIPYTPEEIEARKMAEDYKKQLEEKNEGLKTKKDLIKKYIIQWDMLLKDVKKLLKIYPDNNRINDTLCNNFYKHSAAYYIYEFVKEELDNHKILMQNKKTKKKDKTKDDIGRFIDPLDELKIDNAFNAHLKELFSKET